MKKTLLAGALGVLAAVPALAQQPAAPPARTPGVPHTVHSEMMVYRDTNYNGEAETLETPRSTVRTDWPIKSIAIHPGDTWQICARPRFREPCILVNRSVPDASAIGIDNQMGSARLAPAASQ